MTTKFAASVLAAAFVLTLSGQVFAATVQGLRALAKREEDDAQVDREAANKFDALGDHDKAAEYRRIAQARDELADAERASAAANDMGPICTKKGDLREIATFEDGQATMMKAAQVINGYINEDDKLTIEKFEASARVGRDWADRCEKLGY
jgi:hypothetical protein